MTMTARDTYSWHVTYQDGRMVWEHAMLEEVPFHMVATPDVASVALRRGAAIAHIVQVPRGALPVFFRRRRLVLNATGGGGGPHPSGAVHCIGWKQQDSGVSEAVYLFVWEDGTSLLTDNLNAV